MTYFIKCFKNCDSFDNLWYILYIKRNKTILLSASNMSHEYALHQTPI